MKKAMISLLAAILVLSLCVSSAFAAGNRRGSNFADADGDGVCDNCPNDGVCPQDGTGRRANRTGVTQHNARFTDADRDGVCDVCGNLDADGDGVCDLCPNDLIRPQDGTGAQHGRLCGRNR